jgi:hypothetical protein
MSALNIGAILTASVALSAAAIPATAHAEAPAALCQRVGTADQARPIPEDLVPAVNAAFATQMPVREAMDTTVFRCAQGHVMVCTVGANLPCGKANSSHAPNPGIIRWCRKNPEAGFIPAVVTGHDTVYEWRCHAGAPHIERQILHIDPRGFVAEYWKPLP